jgi:hypothetical protein
MHLPIKKSVQKAKKKPGKGSTEKIVFIAHAEFETPGVLPFVYDNVGLFDVWYRIMFFIENT